MDEKAWDKKLNIDTVGRDDSMEDDHHYPYEPTPYTVLERLAESGYIDECCSVVDYGCGKGRVSFFLNDVLGCKVIGIDFDACMWQMARSNLECYRNRSENTWKLGSVIVDRKQKRELISVPEFLCQSAEKFEIGDADVFYFFNPFSVEILKSVIGKIRKSYYNDPREMRLIFYYPSNAYVGYLMSVPELGFVDEIDCRDLFLGNDEREKILIFEMF